jgi:hypothetical protein
MHTSPRLALQIPDATDNESLYPVVSAQRTGVLDNAAMYYSGTLVARASLTGLVAGTLYYATDTTLLYEYNGTTWKTLVTADTAALYLSGTLSARPLASAVAAGTFYYATDTGVYSICTGSAWGTMLVAGPWVALTLATNVGVFPSSYTPSARLVGDTVELSGVAQNNTGAAIFATTLATVPTSARPASQATITPFSYFVSVTTAGALVAQTSIPDGSAIPLDGLSYRLV